MRITNRAGLPQAIVSAVSGDHHRSGDYSATESIKPPKEVWLKRRHFDNIEVDASDRIWALFGKAIHYVLEKGMDKNALQEEYLSAKILGKSLTGTPDHFIDGIITDYKLTTVWSIIYKSSYKSWEQQLNIYAFLLGLNGYEVNKLQVIALLRDWQKNKAMSHDYPDDKIQIINFDLWPKTKQRDFIEERIKLHESYKKTPDDEIPECSPEDRWQTADVFAVMKEGRKSAIKLFADIDEAKVLADTDDKYYIDERRGTNKKCIDYCECNQFCNFFKNTVLPF